MAAKAIFVLCASALIAECAVGQYLGRIAEPIAPCRGSLAYDSFAYGPAFNGRVGGIPAVDISIASSLNAAHARSLPVTSSSCAAPTGLAVTSENMYEGFVGLAGNLPFLGTAATEGMFPTAGLSAISYGCGDGAIGITVESPISNVYSPVTLAPTALDMAAWGYKESPAFSCGCGTSYIY